MPTFQKVKIKDHCEITSSKRIFADEYLSSGVPFYRGKEISQKQKSSSEISDAIYISKDKYEEIKAKYGVPQKGDLLLTSVGTIGNPYLVKDNEEFYFKDGNLTWFRNFKGVDSQWLYYWLLSPQGKAELNKCTIGSSQKAYTISLLYGLQIDLLNISRQSHIASIFSTYDDLIENNEKRIRALEEMAQLLYTEWFVKFKFPGHEKAKMVDSGTEYGVIPEGWEVKKLGEISREMRESVNPKALDPETFYVGLEHIPRKTILLSDWGKASDINSSKLKFRIGDILFSKIRPYFHKVVSAPFDGISSSDTVIIRANKPLFQTFVLMCVSTENFVAYATNNSQGTKMPRADWKSMSKYPILIPNEAILNIFSIRVSEIVTQINALMFQNKNLSKMRDLLIPQLVTGKRILK